MPHKGAQSQGDCVPCLAGYTCPNGVTTSTADMEQCKIRKYCPAGGNEIDCPAGAYCPLGSETPTYCDVGKYSDGTSEYESTVCLDCLANYFCGSRGFTSGQKGACGNGFVCNAGSISSAPTKN